jgi:hypothetical protein
MGSSPQNVSQGFPIVSGVNVPQQQPFGGFPQQQPFGGFPQQQPFGGFPQQQPFGGFPQQQPFIPQQSFGSMTPTRPQGQQSPFGLPSSKPQQQPFGGQVQPFLPQQQPFGGQVQPFLPQQQPFGLPQQQFQQPPFGLPQQQFQAPPRTGYTTGISVSQVFVPPVITQPKPVYVQPQVPNLLVDKETIGDKVLVLYHSGSSTDIYLIPLNEETVDLIQDILTINGLYKGRDILNPDQEAVFENLEGDLINYQVTDPLKLVNLNGVTIVNVGDVEFSLPTSFGGLGIGSSEEEEDYDEEEY